MSNLRDTGAPVDIPVTPQELADYPAREFSALIRIQRRRTAGWRLPAGCVCVSRPSKFGNPYDIGLYGRELALRLFANSAMGIWDPSVVPATVNAEQRQLAYQSHCAWMHALANKPVEMIRFELHGKSVACWCSLADACHGDILLRIANE